MSAPSSTKTSDGLGPLFNARSCQRCHLKDGRGHPPGVGERAESMFLRLSIPPRNTADRTALREYRELVIAEPTYGGQLQQPSLEPGGDARDGDRLLKTPVVLTGGEDGPVKRVWRILPPRKEDKMSRKRYTPEQIISMLREAEVALAQGQSIGQACRTLGVSEQSYYRWRKEYGGLRTDQAKRLKDLEKENGRLRKAISDLTLDKLILKEALEGNC